MSEASLVSDGTFFSRLAELYVKMTEVERQVLLEVAERLELGRHRYGGMTPDTLLTKDWRKEAGEEDADGLVYRAALIVAERRKRD